MSTAFFPFPARSGSAPSISSRSASISALMSTSSAKSILRPVSEMFLSAETSSFSAAAVSGSTGANSSPTVKVVPSPFLLVTSIVPSIMSTSLFVMAMPRPEPPYLLVELSSSCENASNIFGRYSSSIPAPVSLMTNFTLQLSPVPPAQQPSASVRNVTFPPSGVNLTAFPSMLISTCLTFMLSPMQHGP